MLQHYFGRNAASSLSAEVGVITKSACEWCRAASEAVGSVLKCKSCSKPACFQCSGSRKNDFELNKGEYRCDWCRSQLCTPPPEYSLSNLACTYCSVVFDDEASPIRDQCTVCNRDFCRKCTVTTFPDEKFVCLACLPFSRRGDNADSLNENSCLKQSIRPGCFSW